MKSVRFSDDLERHVYDLEPSLHCFERLRLVPETLLKRVLGGDDEVAELRCDSSSFSFQ